MKETLKIDRMKTGIPNFDLLLNGGIPRNSVIVLGGSPGAGKTTLALQMAFANSSPDQPVLVLQTLSEPTAKTIRYLEAMNFYDPKKLNQSVFFYDLGDITRNAGLEQAAQMLMDQIKKVRPSFVIIDSFRVFEDLADSDEELRKFTYEVAVNLMAWECTAFLIGEYRTEELEIKPLSSVVDGIIILTSNLKDGERQRHLQIMKMRGTSHSQEVHQIEISDNGIKIYNPGQTIKRSLEARQSRQNAKRTDLGLPSVRPLFKEAIPFGSTMLVSGPSGSGKTLFGLEFIYRGAKQYKQKGIYISFEETPDRLISSAQKLGWDLEKYVTEGIIELLYIPLPSIQVNATLSMLQKKVTDFKAQRLVVDSMTMMLHKIKDEILLREKVFLLSTIVQNSESIGIFTVDLAYSQHELSAYGWEETLVDGVINLSTQDFGMDRKNFIEVYKFKNVEHLKGRHQMALGSQGLKLLTTKGARKSSDLNVRNVRTKSDRKKRKKV